jgi:hypothetical protein
MDLLSEEVGLIALDLQDNGITREGAQMALDILELNKEIQILDLRNNEFGNLIFSLMLESSILNQINNHLFRNKMHSKEISQIRNITFKEWMWHEGDPLDHTFFKARASERVRVNTASATARRRVLAQKSASGPTRSAAKSKNTLKETMKKPKIPKSQHKSTPLVIPLIDSNLNIEPSKPCHVLRLYKKEKSFNSLVQENTLLRERLQALESGIVNVEQCLSDPKDDVPALPKPDMIKTKNQHVQDDMIISKKMDPPVVKQKKKKKKQEIKQLLEVVEASLISLTRVLDKMQHKK